MAWLGKLLVFCLRARAARELDIQDRLLRDNLMLCVRSCLHSCFAADKQFLQEIIQLGPALIQPDPVLMDLEARLHRAVDILRHLTKIRAIDKA